MTPLLSVTGQVLLLSISTSISTEHLMSERYSRCLIVGLAVRIVSYRLSYRDSRYFLFMKSGIETIWTTVALSGE